jgi:engulfment/cell motility protein 1
VSLAFSLETESENECANFVAPDEKTFQMWTDGINALLGNPVSSLQILVCAWSAYLPLLFFKMTSELTTQELDILLSMEIKLRLLEIEGVTIPEDAPPIPPPPPNYDFTCKNI